MTKLLHELISDTAHIAPENEAVFYDSQSLTYEYLCGNIFSISNSLLNIGLQKQGRVAIYLHKCLENVQSMFATSQAGGVFVPINPLLKAPQVAHILNDCDVEILVTSKDRLINIKDALTKCVNLKTIVLVENEITDLSIQDKNILAWKDFLALNENHKCHRIIDTNMAAILYTSGSTGKPKGVVLSHSNMVIGAASVSQYLNNQQEDRLLAVLPFSFDYGFSQLSTAFLSGACAYLLDYFLPKDVLVMAEKHSITGLAGVPSLWISLATMNWPDNVTKSLRYITNSGGAMPEATLNLLQKSLTNTEVFLMYGLTEAFRSTYLPPDQVSIRPTSIGKAIPNAEIIVVNEDGIICETNEPGELVHKGSLVAMGYWNDREKTEKRFRPSPDQLPEIMTSETAVWSGDLVKMDEEGYLYFISRNDEMIKTSGYRVSPTEVEEVLYSSGLVSEACALGIKHQKLGEAIVVIAASQRSDSNISTKIINFIKDNLPNYMVPHEIILLDSLPKNPNGKIDRSSLKETYREHFTN